MFYMNNSVYITYSRYKLMFYILLNEDAIEVNLYTIQLFHRVQCIQLKGQIQAAVLMTAFTLHPEVIIQGRLLHVNLLYITMNTSHFLCCRSQRMILSPSLSSSRDVPAKNMPSQVGPCNFLATSFFKFLITICAQCSNNIQAYYVVDRYKLCIRICTVQQELKRKGVLT